MNAETRHPVRWIFSGGVSATDIGYPLWMVWVVLAFHHVPHSQRVSNPFYTRMDAIAPLDVWMLVAALLAVAVVSCALAQRFRALLWTYIGLALWWAVLGGIAYSIGSGWLGTGFFICFAAWALVRQAQVGALLAARRARR